MCYIVKNKLRIKIEYWLIILNYLVGIQIFIEHITGNWGMLKVLSEIIMQSKYLKQSLKMECQLLVRTSLWMW